jgi:hypothetical protein
MGKLARYAKEFLTDWRCFYYYPQKSIRIPGLRRFLARTVAITRPKSAALSPQDRATRLTEEMERNGYSYVTDLIQPSQVRDIREFLATRDCRELSRPELGTFRPPELLSPECRKLGYDPETVLECPHILEIANHPVILGAVERMFGCKPTISIMEVWWSIGGQPTDSTGATYQDDMFHRDVEDLAFVKLFIYLTDVDEDSGPHAFVPGTHRSPLLVERKPLSVEEVTAAFGKDSIRTYLAPIGTAFMENTWGVHRATPAKSKHRLICSVTYSLTGWSPQSPRRACSPLRGRPFDPYINRVYCFKDGKGEAALA